MRAATYVIAPAAGILLAMGLSVSGAAAQSVQLLGDFRDWSAYASSQGAGRMCFVLAKPEDVRPTPGDYTQSYLYLTHRPADGVRNEFNFIAGFALAPEQKLTASIGGRDFSLFVDKDAAWLEDPGQSDDLAGAMRAGATLTISGQTADGTAFTESYSLSGATAASRAIDSECG